jgi:hypothetical protein
MQVTRTQYQMRLYRNGKPRGGPFDFDSRREALEYARDAARRSGEAVRFFDYREKVDASWDGLCVSEIRTFHERGGPLNGVRIYA